MPLFSSPTSHPLALSRFITHVGDELMPSLCSKPPQKIGFLELSSNLLGTKKRLIPFIPAGASGVRAKTRCIIFSVRSCSPNEIQIF